MKTKRKKRRVPLEIIAVRRGNRLAERELKGDGFHSRTRVERSKKVYSRKAKHKKETEE
ncbi:MAG: hypothetical protein IJL38_05710 [Bacteroidales bacterium]|nr:hypothetical protein [Bacteroidales bacterium]